MDDYPPDSKFETLIAEKEFIETGYEIKKALQYELGNGYEILYKP
ncbi:hypothetical protein [Acinetobacter portensis]|nr:hypothetical protein [Acinetobacter portensis]